MSGRLVSLFVVALAALGVAATPALASVGDEVSVGKAVAGQLYAGKASCSTLTDPHFERLGEYVMDRLAVLRAAHAAMNRRMERALGSQGTDRMHELIGRRFAGCGAGNASNVRMGPGVMGSSTGMGDGGWGAMMGSSAWSWMHNGSWQHMSSGDWRSLARSMMGTRYSMHGADGWSTVGVVAAVLGALLVGALLAVLVLRRPWQRRPPATPGAA